MTVAVAILLGIIGGCTLVMTIALQGAAKLLTGSSIKFFMALVVYIGVALIWVGVGSIIDTMALEKPLAHGIEAVAVFVGFTVLLVLLTGIRLRTCSAIACLMAMLGGLLGVLASAIIGPALAI